MSTSQFDPSVFLDAQVTEVNEKRPPIPTENPDHENGLYLAVIGEITTSSGTISKGDNAGKPWVSMVIPLRLQIPDPTTLDWRAALIAAVAAILIFRTRLGIFATLATAAILGLLLGQLA